MKKTSLLFGAAVLMLAASCSNDEVVNVAENHGAAIGFSNFVDKSTRADDKTIDNLANMEVWGTTKFTAGNISAIFVKEEVKKAGSEGSYTWSYDPLQYWIPTNEYSFAAVAPYNATGVTVTQSTDADKAMTGAGITITFDNTVSTGAKGNEDLLFDTQKVASAVSDQGAVEFTLKHMLSRVNFKFENAFASDNYSLRVTDVKITDATGKASIDKSAGKTLWTAAENPENFLLGFSISNDAIAADANAETETHYLIPLEGEKSHTVTFGVQLLMKDASDNEVNVGKVQEFTVEIPKMQFTNGYSYTFVASIDENNINTDPENPVVSKDPIEFTVKTVEGYTDKNDNVEGSDNYNDEESLDITQKVETETPAA